MIERPQVFGSDYIPKIVCRDAEKQALKTVLSPITDGERANDAILHGPTGTGKTATIRYMLAELDRVGSHFQSAYVSCVTADDKREIMLDVVEPLVANPARLESKSKTGLVRELCNAVDRPYVVVVDEADCLADSELSVLYDLYETAGVSVVLVINDRTAFLGGLRDRFNSRFAGAREIEFDSYTEDELATIVKQRARDGLRGGIDDEAVGTIAAVADNARIAIAFLETAARSVHGGRITATDIVEAVPDAYEQLRERALSRLGTSHQRVFTIVEQHGPVSTSDVRERYADVTGDKLGRTTIYRYLQKLMEYDCIEANGETKGTQYRMKEIPGGVPEGSL